ncbi:glycosyltransferase family 4 protein [Streptomyces spongiae]|uniref:Glycosyltransferase family 4 protein n=1 Tax=Streptomyces spongiae TaxID=565072 RepID=A0A5N8XHA9_9ACTN|nr:glycosyltransferase family 4 protein [Streptomyces spongiae]MPY58697.1 glycosyltransferase family 4 protein [Streptomyces spongiae]
MRILQIVNIGFEAGGAEKSVRLITEGLRARGHTVSVVATDRMAAGHELFADHIVPAVNGGPARRLFGYFWHHTAYRRLGRILAEFEPDVVHLHTIGEFSPSVLAATRRYPRLLTARGPEDWTLKLLRWNLGTATNGGRLSATDTARYLYLRFLQRPGYLVWLRGLDRVLALSQYMADTVRGDVGRVPLFVVPNGTESGFGYEPIADTESVLFTGRLERVKGVDVLLTAFRQVVERHPGARLVIIGDGADRARLESLAADLTSQGRVVFRGWLGKAEVAECLRAASVVAVPSRWPEVFGRVVLEAFQTGRPVVASRCGGLPELISDDNGRLVDPGDARGLADALSSLLGDRATLERLGKGAAQCAERYRLDAVVDAHEEHYQAVLAGRR